MSAIMLLVPIFLYPSPPSNQVKQRSVCSKNLAHTPNVSLTKRLKEKRGFYLAWNRKWGETLSILPLTQLGCLEGPVQLIPPKQRVENSQVKFLALQRLSGKSSAFIECRPFLKNSTWIVGFKKGQLGLGLYLLITVWNNRFNPKNTSTYFITWSMDKRQTLHGLASTLQSFLPACRMNMERRQGVDNATLLLKPSTDSPRTSNGEKIQTVPQESSIPKRGERISAETCDLSVVDGSTSPEAYVAPETLELIKEWVDSFFEKGGPSSNLKDITPLITQIWAQDPLLHCKRLALYQREFSTKVKEVEAKILDLQVQISEAACPYFEKIKLFPIKLEFQPFEKNPSQKKTAHQINRLFLEFQKSEQLMEFEKENWTDFAIKVLEVVTRNVITTDCVCKEALDHWKKYLRSGAMKPFSLEKFEIIQPDIMSYAKGWRRQLRPYVEAIKGLNLKISHYLQYPEIPGDSKLAFSRIDEELSSYLDHELDTSEGPLKNGYFKCFNPNYLSIIAIEKKPESISNFQATLLNLKARRTACNQTNLTEENRKMENTLDFIVNKTASFQGIKGEYSLQSIVSNEKPDRETILSLEKSMDQGIAANLKEALYPIEKLQLLASVRSNLIKELKRSLGAFSKILADLCSRSDLHLARKSTDSIKLWLKEQVESLEIISQHAFPNSVQWVDICANFSPVIQASHACLAFSRLSECLEHIDHQLEGWINKAYITPEPIYHIPNQWGWLRKIFEFTPCTSYPKAWASHNTN